MWISARRDRWSIHPEVHWGMALPTGGGGAGQELGPPQKPEIDGRAHVSGSWKPSNVDVQSMAHTVTRSLTRQHDKDHLDLCRPRAIIHGRVRAPLDSTARSGLARQEDKAW